jgi:hypothetical protein
LYNVPSVHHSRCQKVVPALIKAGLSRHSTNHAAETPLHAAARADCPACYLNLCASDGEDAVRDTLHLNNDGEMSPLDLMMMEGSGKVFAALYGIKKFRFVVGMNYD